MYVLMVPGEVVERVEVSNIHKPSTRKMSAAHEDYITTVLGGRRTRNSGAVWSDQMDVRNDVRDDRFAFAADGKSTFSESIGVSRAMWKKAVEQSGDLDTCLPLRWYDTYRLDVGLDLIVISMNTFEELLEIARNCDCG